MGLKNKNQIKLIKNKIDTGIMIETISESAKEIPLEILSKPKELLKPIGEKFDFEKHQFKMAKMFHTFFEKNYDFQEIDTNSGIYGEKIRFIFDLPWKGKVHNLKNEDIRTGKVEYTVELSICPSEHAIGITEIDKQGNSRLKPQDVWIYEWTVHEKIDPDDGGGLFHRICDISLRPKKDEYSSEIYNRDSNKTGTRIIGNLCDMILESKGNISLDKEIFSQKFYDSVNRESKHH